MYFRIILYLFLLSLPNISVSQVNNNPNSYSDIFSHYDSYYGSNPELVNGTQYLGYDSRIKGHQFFNDFDFFDGSVTINGTEYKNLQINYDIFSNKLILKHKDYADNINYIELFNSSIDNFKLDNKTFIYTCFLNKPKGFYQLIDNGYLKFIISWRKEKYILYSNKPEESFTNPKKEKFLQIDKTTYSLNNNRSFVKLFSQEKRPLIKKYLKSNKINIKKANDFEMKKLLTYCTDLYSNK
ncbi:MAG: hypothetical protein AB9846_01045 [Tenuifilaceae bacterium]